MRLLFTLSIPALLAVGCGSGPEAPKGPPKPEVGSGRHDMPLKTYLSLAPREPKVFTLACSLSDSYHGDFRDGRDVFYSVRMRSADGTTILGYADRGRQPGERLASLLKDGKEHALTLEIQHTAEDSPRTVTIRRLVE